MPARPLVPLCVVAGLLAGCTSGHAPQRPTRSAVTPSVASSRTGTSASSAPAARSSAAPSSTAPRSRPPSTARPSPSTSPTRVRPPRHRPHAHRGDPLPLGYPTGPARQVVTVVAGAQSDTEGTVQAWRKVTGGWRKVGPEVHAWLGYDGMTPHPSESLSAVPMGSYTLTQAFGYDADPGTALPYRQTTPADWWISESGPYYNTEQHCDSNCPFTQGSPNEHLYYETPYYDYAVVIDYNTRNAPTGVRQGAGSAFFLHVSVGRPTQGCVAIDRDQLVRIMRWLRPEADPRILIGTS